MADAWMSRKDLAKALLCSERTVDNLATAGVFVAGQDFYRAGLKSGPLVFNLTTCRTAMLQHTAAREKAARDESAPKYDAQHLDELITELQSNG
ncbi:hypothetical protein [Synechococcus sp. MIT S9509]|uniref:hypothetical protein n=1 Tax=Synechococcus sp. MIT S9509 TaxID=1801630 RepID=UPI00082C7685|nr:hypothetical protein [Synechococcus sp. MIT S9509]